MQLRQVLNLLRHFGPSWLFYRTIYSQQMRWGLFRARMPIQSWAERPLASFSQLKLLEDEGQYSQYRQESAPKFFFSPKEFPDLRGQYSPWDSSLSNPLKQSADLEQGILRFFSHSDIKVSFPPDWHQNYMTGISARQDAHWSKIDDFSSGDIKLIWEPNRFSSAFTLVRAYARTGDDHYAELFWQLVESWRIANPPQQGVNWKCGQEVGLRAIAWCFGLYGFLQSAATTSQRIVELVQMIAVTGHRIEANLRYALSQKNNHGISEAMALWTIGKIFPEFSRATYWERTGRHLLEQQAKELIYEDGAFSQHSVNYHRVMLQNYLWSMRLAEIHDQPFSQDLYRRVEAAGGFLYQLQDIQSGQVPNYGHNDGALVLPLNNCDYSDYRPIVQATQYLAKRTRCFPPGPWDEDLLWLFGNESLDAVVESVPQTDLVAEKGGYYTLRTSASFIMTRIPRFRHRPAQADASHVDLWWRGQNIAVDPGTFSYNASPPWDNVLGNTEYHNTVTVDKKDQMSRAGRFLWLPWLKGKITQRKISDERRLQYLEGQHDGYLRLNSPVNYRRAILRLGEEHWLIIDHLAGSRIHDYRLHWLFADVPFELSEAQRQLKLHTAAGLYYAQWLTLSEAAITSVVRADTSSPRGWQSRYYHDREPAISLSLNIHERSAFFYTLLGPDDCQLKLQENELRITSSNWKASIHLARQTVINGPLVETVYWSDKTQEELSLL